VNTNATDFKFLNYQLNFQQELKFLTHLKQNILFPPEKVSKCYSTSTYRFGVGCAGGFAWKENEAKLKQNSFCFNAKQGVIFVSFYLESKQQKEADLN